ncbi:6-hydroxymethylpterin diphosphokinase MptE-like protein [Thalassovita taeanensis]|uniref:6-hydroxymethylpterin diphosphokinase MptE-like domain-containing protein n=1 Tax=Thalassovita taeanensis TaxID=657014 RepID=A0A1H9L2A0_9RHOB|nr:6-hydroxymethylpterin diphosphokinase MptE-like protein [Thalassovita taeanensis]SER05602.1 Protein of unknown function DUF115 [Thalassovita taeanensis]
MRFDCFDPTSPLLRFHDQHRGQRCVIVCNGPSLNQMDLGFLKNEIVFGLNKIYLGLERFGFYPRYMVAVNRKVIEQSADQYREMKCVKFVSDRGADLLPRDALTYHIRSKGMTGRFYRDITEGVREGHTVTHAALQLAYFMGFSNVVIIGMDHHFPQSGTPNAELRMQGDDPNHFSPDYFRGHKWDAPNLEESEVSYRAAQEVFAADGRQITDATLGGHCQVFPKVDYRTFFEL